MRKEKRQIKKILKAVFVFTLISSWIFSGWPQVWKNLEFPPKTKNVLAADTGVKTAETATNTSWTSGWTATNLASDDTNIAIHSSTGTVVGTLSGFNFGIPADAISIDGIQVNIEAKETHFLCNGYLNTYLSWDNGSSYTSAKRSPDSGEFSKSFIVYTEGGATDTWGRSWSVSEFSDANFMIKIEGFNNKLTKQIEVDYVQVTVYYTPSATLPVASSVSIDNNAASITLTENTTKTVSCTAIVTDSNGFADITSVEAKLYRTSVGAGAADNDNTHYTLSGDANCVPSGGSDSTENYTCDFSVQFFAEPAEWTCQVTPSDSGGAGTPDTDTITMNSLNALNVAATIAYGNMGLGTNSGASPTSVQVTNTGNTIMDPQVSSAAAMTCATGTIAVGNQEWSASTFTYGAGTALTGTPATIDLNLPKPTTTTPVTDNSFWGIAIPATGVDGACTGSNTFTAIAGS
ncbi:MAG: hypothetical protein U9N04_00635 [Patescibacteria group bacterium]|nr:hypothetical protein [Patescibacteria group bacterium]